MIFYRRARLARFVSLRFNFSMNSTFIRKDSSRPRRLIWTENKCHAKTVSGEGNPRKIIGNIYTVGHEKFDAQYWRMCVWKIFRQMPKSLKTFFFLPGAFGVKSLRGSVEPAINFQCYTAHQRIPAPARFEIIGLMNFLKFKTSLNKIVYFLDGIK